MSNLDRIRSKLERYSEEISTKEAYLEGLKTIRPKKKTKDILSSRILIRGSSTSPISGFVEEYTGAEGDSAEQTKIWNKYLHRLYMREWKKPAAEKRLRRALEEFEEEEEEDDEED